MPPASTSSWEKEVLGAGSGGAGVLVVLVLVSLVWCGAVAVVVAVVVGGLAAVGRGWWYRRGAGVKAVMVLVTS